MAATLSNHQTIALRQDLDKKLETIREHDIESSNTSPSIKPLEQQEDFSPAEQKKILRRIDRRLILTCGFMYCVSLMDRTNLSIAAIAGMNNELYLDVGFRYSTIAVVFSITYILFQPPATVLVRKFGARPFLASITFAWGATMIGFGFVQSWNVMIPLRMLLGLLEAGFFPGCVYLISTWYSRYEVQKRYSVFYAIGTLASASAGILAYGLTQMKGVGGISGWRWVFIMEGILTCVIGVVGYFLLVDFPDRSAKTSLWFLNEKECQFVIRRIDKDRDDSETPPFSFKLWLSSGQDMKVWCFALLFFCLGEVNSSLAYFLPTMLHESLHYSTAASQCLLAPPHAFAAVLMYSLSCLADRYRIRGPFIVATALLCLAGLPVMSYGSGSGIKYFGVFLVVGGASANVPACMAYQANNVRGSWKRAFTSATLVGSAGLGGVAGAFVFRSQDAPEYRMGIWAGVLCTLVMVVVVSGLSVFMRCANKRAEKGKVVLEGSEAFRYTM